MTRPSAPELWREIQREIRLARVPAPALRRQLTLFVAGPERTALDALRARADPVQHARIPTHATLVRDEDVTDWSVVLDRFATLAPLRLELEFGPPRLLEGGAVALTVSGPTTAFDALRARLLVGQPGATRVHPPHITLLHPRNHASWGMTPAEVCAQHLPTRVTFEPAAWIEQKPCEPWRVRGTPGDTAPASR